MPWRMYSATGTLVFWCRSLSCWSCSGVMYTVVEIFLRISDCELPYVTIRSLSTARVFRVRVRVSAMRTLLAGILLITACGGSAKKAEAPKTGGLGEGGNEDLNIPKTDASLCDPKGKKVALFDLNQDQKPDVWKLLGDKDRLTCKQVDLNHDEKKDYTAQFDESGNIIAEEYDFDFDGRFDARIHFDRKTGKRFAAERVSGFREKPDVWEKYGSDEKVEAVRRDRNGDGRPDYWEQYLMGSLDKILYDDNFDGTIDRKEEAHPERDLGAAPAVEETAPALAQPKIPEPEPEPAKGEPAKKEPAKKAAPPAKKK
jgi:hypothetical protein